MKKHISLSYAVLIIAAVLSGSCAVNVEEVSKGGIAGIVADKVTGEPVPTVKLKLSPGGNSTVTGSDGSFQFEELEAGEYTVTYTKDGYRDGTEKLLVKNTLKTDAHLLIERIPAIITADKELLDFGSNTSLTTLSFNIVNSYYEPLECTVTANCAWVSSIKPAGIIRLQHGKTATIIVTIDRSSLLAGDNESYIILETNGGGSAEVKLIAVGLDKHLAKLNVLEASELSASSAKFNAEMTDWGYPEISERGFIYAESSMPDLDNAIERVRATMTTDKKFSYTVRGLELDKDYYVRAYAVNSIGVSYSANQIRFKTEPVAGRVEMNNVTNVNLLDNSAVFHGTVLSLGDPSYAEKGFVYSTESSAPTIYDEKVVAVGTGKGDYDVKVSNLQINTAYYVRAFIKNEAGVAYGSKVVSFNTEQELPIVTTDSATDEDRENHSVILHGTIKNSGAPAYTERGFVYSDIYESPTIYDNKIVVNGLGNGSFEYRSTELPSDKSYYVRAYATNVKGTAYGSTIKIFPNVYMLKVANIMVQLSDIGYGYWEDVNSMCENSTIEGFTDWRLPDKDELMSIYTNRNAIGNFATDHTYPYGYSGYRWCYWSSSATSSTHYYVNMRVGSISDAGANAYYSDLSGRCVRTIDSSK